MGGGGGGGYGTKAGRALASDPNPGSVTNYHFDLVVIKRRLLKMTISK